MNKEIISMANGSVKAELVLKNAKIVNVFTKEIVDGDVAIFKDIIVGVGKYSGIKEVDLSGKYIAPGFIDAHVHMESSMVTPCEFAKTVVKMGTTTVIADPHEIANVAGFEGIKFMLDQAKNAEIDIYIMVPSCVPATPFEHSGAEITAADIKNLLLEKGVIGLAEMMNYPGTINGDKQILEKINAANGHIIDGHAPGVSGKNLQAYRLAGISTDHECLSYDDAKEKLSAGMYVLVREGGAAQDLDNIIAGIVANNTPTNYLAFCTDDKNISDIFETGHINNNIKKAVKCGMSAVEAISIASINAARCYNLKNVGAICAGFKADLVVLDDLESIKINSVYKNGKPVNDEFLKNKKPLEISRKIKNSVNYAPFNKDAFAFDLSKPQDAIALSYGMLYTDRERLEPDFLQKSLGNGTVCKLAVVERHRATGNVAVCPLIGYGLNSGAIAMSIAHDSHNIIIAGVSDEDMMLALEEIKRMQGGIAIANKGKVIDFLELSVGGLMSASSAKEVAEGLRELNKLAHKLGVPDIIEPFVMLSFLALPVIPEIKLTDMGLFDVGKFEFIK